MISFAKVIVLTRSPEVCSAILNGWQTLVPINTLPNNFEGWVYIHCSGGKGKTVLLKDNDRYKTISAKEYRRRKSNGEALKSLNFSIIARFYYSKGEIYMLQKHRYYGRDVFRYTEDPDVQVNDKEVKPKERLDRRTGYVFDQLWDKAKEVDTGSIDVLQRELRLWPVEALEELPRLLRIDSFFADGKQLKWPPKNWRYAFKEVEEN